MERNVCRERWVLKINFELAVISKILTEKDLNYIFQRGVDDTWFLGYKSIWEFIINYNNQYGGVPSVRTVLEKFDDVDIPKIDDGFDYIVDQFRDQNLTYGLRAMVEQIGQELDKSHNPHDVMKLALESSYELSTKYDESPDRDIIHEFDSRMELTTDRVAYREEFKEADFLKTGLLPLDERAPLMEGNLVTIIGDTGSFKSFISLLIAMNVVRKKHVALVSLEMTKDEVGWRADTISANEMEYDLTNRGMVFGENINLMDYRKMLAKRADDLDFGLWTSDTEGATHGVGSTQVIAKFDHYVRRFGDDFGLFIVDYTTLLEDANDWNDIRKITRRLKATAQRLQKPCLQVAQSRRGTRGREITRDDVGLSYSMVQDSDKVFTITRESKDYLNILCDKNRMGEESWRFFIKVSPNVGEFEVVDNSTAHQF